MTLSELRFSQSTCPVVGCDSFFYMMLCLQSLTSLGAGGLAMCGTEHWAPLITLPSAGASEEDSQRNSLSHADVFSS